VRSILKEEEEQRASRRRICHFNRGAPRCVRRRTTQAAPPRGHPQCRKCFGTGHRGQKISIAGDSRPWEPRQAGPNSSLLQDERRKKSAPHASCSIMVLGADNRDPFAKTERIPEGGGLGGTGCSERLFLRVFHVGTRRCGGVWVGKLLPGAACPTAHGRPRRCGESITKESAGRFI